MKIPYLINISGAEIILGDLPGIPNIGKAYLKNGIFTVYYGEILIYKIAVSNILSALEIEKQILSLVKRIHNDKD